MPKIVDHDQRRLELVDATWRIIARLGMEGATMREIAEEAGFANGALKPYFPTKDLLLTSAFGHVFNRTNQRIATMTEGLSGIAALRAFCAEVLPLDEERVNEARIVIPFWQKALNDAHMAALHSESMQQVAHHHRGALRSSPGGRRDQSPHRGRRRRRSPAEHDARRADRCGLVPRRAFLAGPCGAAGSLPRAAGGLASSLQRDDLRDVVKDWFLVEPYPGKRPNVILRAAERVPNELPPLVVAADLAERPGVREQQAAREILRSIHAH